ncbi:MAG: peptidylprolyl isomerase [Dysgonamonadaceae bacterium]|jgi:peptidyl-prolyl cis-trans isomerase SurA|nr:peptidylprolyl isomerase [Dysgonamonadaceae bacterium]
MSRKFFFLAVYSLIFSAGMQLSAQSNLVDGVIWVIGDNAILLSDVENARMDMELQKTHLSGDPYCTIPEQLAIQKLFLHQAKLDSIEISDSDVNQEVEARINYYIGQAGSQEKFEEYVNKSVNEYRNEIRKILKEQQTVGRMQHDLVSKVKVTPSDVRSYFSRIPQDSLPYIPTTVEVEIITTEPTISIEETDDIKRRLREYTELVTSGQREFSTLARANSDDKASAIRGGDLGFRSRTDLLPEFATVAFELNDPKRVSRIFKTEYGYHIVQLIEKRGDRINVRHILLKEHVETEALDAAKLRLDSIRNDILKEKGGITFEEAATWLSFDKETRNNKGLMVNNDYNGNMDNNSERYRTSRFEMSELPAEVAKAVDTLKMGEISKPFIMITDKQKEVAAIVRLKSRVGGHKASLTEDFQALKSMASSEKQTQVLNDWVTKKIKDTYIRINDNWKNCDFERNGWIQ